MKDTASGHPNSQLSEPEAIRRAQRGDAVAFGHLYKSHSKHVYSVCLRMLKNTSDAEDLTQEIFLRVFRKIGTFRGDSGFSTWLHRVTVNAVLMYLRRKKPTELRAESLDAAEANPREPREAGPGDNSMLGAIDRMNLIRAIRGLPRGYKKFFLLRHVIGYEHQEIARFLGCSTGCSKSQAHKARRRLRSLLLGQPEQEEATQVARARYSNQPF